MIQSYVLSGEPARLPVAEVIELLARQDAAGDADDVGGPPVFQQGAVGHDMEEGWHGRHSFDVRVLTAEREWSSLIAQAVSPQAAANRKLVICNRSGRPAQHLGVEHGFLNMAAVAQWLADGGADVELDGVRVPKAALEPTVVAELQPAATREPEPVAVVELGGRMKKAVLIAKHRPRWSKVENDLKEATREGHWLTPARLDRWPLPRDRGRRAG
jgi:hypothetical protein